jgi:phage portal protein BeeE
MSFLQFVRSVIGGFNLPPGSVGAEILSKLYPGAVGAPAKRGTLQFLEAYNTSPWLRAVESRISSAVASVSWNLYVPRKGGQGKAYRDRELQRARLPVRRSLIKDRLASGDLVRVPDHLLLDVMDKGNSQINGHAVTRLMQVYLDCVGECLLLKERNSAGAPMGFWPIPPHWVIGTPTIDRPSYRISYRSWQADIPASEIVWMRDPNPVNPYDRGSGLMSAAADELDTDEFAAKFVRGFFYNGARPDFIVGPKGTETFDPKDTQRIEQEWNQKHQSFWRSFKPLFASRPFEVFEFKRDFNQLQMIDLRQYERDLILQLPGVPPEMLGVLDHANRATIDAASYIFNTQVVVPRLEFLRNEYQEKLVPEYDERLILDYVSPVEADRAMQLQAARTAPWALTVDEWREMMGQPKLDNGTGQVYMVPVNVTPTQLVKTPQAWTDASAPAHDNIPPAPDPVLERHFRKKEPPPPPNITVNISPIPPPDITVHTEPKALPPRKMRKIIERDELGRISGLREVPIEED